MEMVTMGGVEVLRMGETGRNQPPLLSALTWVTPSIGGRNQQQKCLASCYNNYFFRELEESMARSRRTPGSPALSSRCEKHHPWNPILNTFRIIFDFSGRSLVSQTSVELPKVAQLHHFSPFTQLPASLEDPGARPQHLQGKLLGAVVHPY